MSQSPKQITLTRVELYDRVWQQPMTKLAPQLGLSDVGLAKVCKRYNIPRPPVGYWAKLAHGKAPQKTRLPKLDEKPQEIHFRQEERSKPAAQPVTNADKVADDDLKELIRFEELPENKVVIPDEIRRYQPQVVSTRKALRQGSEDNHGLTKGRWDFDEPILEVSASKNQIPRALKLADLIIQSLISRGHRVIVDREPDRRRRTVEFSVLDELICFRLREKCKRTRVKPEDKKYSWHSDYKYVPNGLFELSFSSKEFSFLEKKWTDGKRKKIEEKLNDFLVGIYMIVQEIRAFRVRRIERERQRKLEQQRRWEQEQARLERAKKIEQLESQVNNWHRSREIREFLEHAKATIESKDLSPDDRERHLEWLTWASEYADTLDPLREIRSLPSSDRRSNKPR